MERKLKLPDGREVVYEGVPVTVTDEGLRRKAAADPDFAPAFKGVNLDTWIKDGTPGLGEDIARSAVGGLSRGVIEGGDAVWRKAPSGLAMMGLDALGAEGALGGLTRASRTADEAVGKAVEATGGHYKPQTTAGRYVGAATQGVGGSLATGGFSPWAMALGGATGLGVQGAEDANLGPAAQLAIAFGLPLTATAARRTLFPKMGYDEVQAAMGVPRRPWYSTSLRQQPEVQAANQQLRGAQQTIRDAGQQGVTLLPAQALQQPNAPQSGIINLQNRVTPTTAGATSIKPILDQQVAQANQLVDNIIGMARESGRYADDLAASRTFYQYLRGQELSPGAVSNIVQQLRSSPMYATRGTSQHNFISRVIDMLENQGTAVAPGGTQVTRTMVDAGRDRVPLLGLRDVPDTPVRLPANTQGNLLDIRAQAATGWPDLPGVPQVQRAEARTALNTGRSPEIAALDEAYGPAMDKQNFVQRLEEAARAARERNPEMVGANFAANARGAPGSTTRQEWSRAIDPVQFEQANTAERIANALTVAERTGFGRGGTRAIEPNEYGQARSSAASAATAAAGLSPRAWPLSIIPGVRQKMMEAETAKIAEALADPTGRRLTELLNYDPNRELVANILRSIGIGYGMESAPTGEK